MHPSYSGTNDPPGKKEDYGGLGSFNTCSLGMARSAVNAGLSPATVVCLSKVCTIHLDT